MRKVLFILMLLTVSGLLSFGQATSFAKVELSSRKVYVQQPIKVKITVYSSTWFADALDFGNLNIPNCFILPFTRTVSGISYIDKKKYASLSFYYLVFPYTDGELEIPALSIAASIPPEGDYKGVATTIKTRAVKFTVTPVPKQFEEDHWMVAKNASIREKWSVPLNQIKVGDVIERLVTIKAFGTLPSFIPDFDIEQVNHTSIYPKDATYKDLKDNKDANGNRSQKVRYLFEKEGDFTIPGIEIEWWNPYAKKLYSRKTPDLNFKVLPNPDLSILATAKDSLNTELPIQAQAEQTNWDNYLNWKNLGLLLATILCLLIVKYTMKKVSILIKNYRLAYKNSDAYYLKKIRNSNGLRAQLNAYYLWRLHHGEYNNGETDNSEFNNAQESIYSENKKLLRSNKFYKSIKAVKTKGKLGNNRSDLVKLNP